MSEQKRQELSAIMQDIIERLKTGEVDWIREFAEASLRVWGVDEMIRQCKAFENTYSDRKNADGGIDRIKVDVNSEQGEFIGIIRELIRKQGV